jgi:hypothetical protein
MTTAPKLSAEDEPQDGEFLCITLMEWNAEEPYAWWFTRVGQTCTVSNVELEEDYKVRQRDDMVAVEKLAKHLEGHPVTHVKGDLVDRLDAAGKARLVRALVTSPLDWYPAWWLGTELWFGDEPAPMLPVAEVNLEGTILRIDNDIFRVGPELYEISEETSGRPVIMLPLRHGRLDLLVSSVYTAEVYPEDDQYESVQLDDETGTTWAGVEVDAADLHVCLANAFGALALIVGDTQLIELTASAKRSWRLTRTDEVSPQPRVALPEAP